MDYVINTIKFKDDSNDEIIYNMQSYGNINTYYLIYIDKNKNTGRFDTFVLDVRS